jgi:uncharacterized protein with GYD domain
VAIATSREEAVSITIMLASFTEQGIKNVKDSPKRAKAFVEMAKKQGVSVRGLYWTMGLYDIVAIAEGNNEALHALALSIGRQGNVRTQTLPAMDSEAMERVLEKVT